MSDSKKPARNSTRRSNGLIVLFSVLVAWTLLIAIGSFHTQASTDFRRPLIVIACMSVFLGGWALALRTRQSR